MAVFKIVQQKYDELTYLLTKESKRKRALFIKDQFKTDVQKSLIEKFIKYLENHKDNVFKVVYVNRETKEICYHIQNHKKDNGTWVDFTVGCTLLFDNFRKIFEERFTLWLDHSWSARGLKRNVMLQYMNDYLNDIKKDNIRTLFNYKLSCNRNKQRLKAFYNRMSKIRECYCDLRKEWETMNPSRDWEGSETVKGLNKQFDMRFIFEIWSMYNLA